MVCKSLAAIGGADFYFLVPSSSIYKHSGVNCRAVLMAWGAMLGAKKGAKGAKGGVPGVRSRAPGAIWRCGAANLRSGIKQNCWEFFFCDFPGP